MELLDQINAALPTLTSAQKFYVTWLALSLKWLPELYSSVVNGGGLVRIVARFFKGENLPKPVRDDYKAELQPLSAPENKPNETK